MMRPNPFTIVNNSRSMAALDVLGGVAPPGDGDGTSQAAALRRQLLADPALHVETLDAATTERLLGRLRVLGAFEPRYRTTQVVRTSTSALPAPQRAMQVWRHMRERWSCWRPLPLAAACSAAVLGATVALLEPRLTGTPDGADPGMEKSPPLGVQIAAPQVLHSSDPALAAHELATALRHAGAVVHLTAIGEMQMLDAELPPASLDAAARTLRQVGLVQPEGGVLRLQVLPVTP